MPRYHVTLHDGREVEVEADSPEHADLAAGEFSQAQPAPRKSQALGFSEGVNNVAQNIAGALGDVPMLSAPARALPTVATLPLRAMIGDTKSRIEAEKAKGVQPGMIGKVAGTTLASLPFGMGSGPAVAGAMQGYLASEGKSPLDKGVDIALGAAGGKATEGLVRGGAALLRGIKDQSARALGETGVRLPPSAAFPVLKKAEDALSSVPFVGGAVRAAKDALRTDVQRAAINHGLKEVGDELPKGMSGHDAVAYAQDAISDYYDNLLPHLKAVPDEEFAEGMSALGGTIRSLPVASQKQFRQILKDSLQVGEDGAMTGRQLKDAETALGQELADYSASGAPADVKMSRAIRAARDELRAMIARQNPERAPDLQAANRAFRIQAIVDDAAAKADNGEFSALLLKTASRKADRTVRKRGTARGEGSPLQDLATHARNVERSVMGNSGTADRLNLTNPLMLAAGLPALAGYKGAQALTRAMSGPRSPLALSLADKLEHLAPRIGLFGGTAVANRPR